MHRIAAVVAGLSLAFVGTSATLAATINVPGDYPTIQGAINASVNGDVIAIAAGTYYEANLNPGGMAITIGSASGNLDVTIDAQQVGSVFVINSGEGSGTEIKDLVITGGSNYYGGGIYCWNNSTPIITGCTIQGNTADVQGGGIFCYRSAPTISDCLISGNTASSGGGIFSEESNPTISGSYICGNEPEQLNGTWNSGGGNDIATNCPVALPPTGACCVSSGCVANSNDDCTALGGTWLGEVSSCDDCAPTCQGDANADGVVDIFDLLKVIEGWGTCP